ncbi:MAG: HPF/RaiA family ribosome-associated protein [Pseudomonadota bacterium]|jgi:ribosomal subunit interface protein
MQFDIRTQGFDLTDALRQHAERRLTCALSRFHGRLGRVSMWLTDYNGPRGGVDKRCLLLVRIAGAPEVLITELSKDLYIAIDRAADRAGRTVARRMGRHNGNAHGPMPQADDA